jgi:hypothetical protein
VGSAVQPLVSADLELNHGESDTQTTLAGHLTTEPQQDTTAVQGRNANSQHGSSADQEERTTSTSHVAVSSTSAAPQHDEEEPLPDFTASVMEAEGEVPDVTDHVHMMEDEGLIELESEAEEEGSGNHLVPSSSSLGTAIQPKYPSSSLGTAKPILRFLLWLRNTCNKI